MPLPTSLDVSPLTERVPLAESRRYAQEVNAGLPKRLQRPIGMLSVLFIGIAVLAIMFLPMSLRFLDGEPSVADILFASFSIAVPVLALLLPVIVLVRWHIESRRRVRLRDFARANGWTYDPWWSGGAMTGEAFGSGGTQDVFDRLTARTDTTTNEFGRLRVEYGSGRSRRILVTEFVQFRLPLELPHILLDARANDRMFGRSNLEIEPSRDQRLKLEGDFDRTFRLYCPSGYEADALYLFAPDVMATLLDHARWLDIEIVGSSVYLYAPKGIVTTDPERWRLLLDTVAALQNRVRQWSNWRDDRLGSSARLPDARPLGVAPPGKRLRTKFPWITLIFVLIFGGFGLFSMGQELVSWIASWFAE